MELMLDSANLEEIKKVRDLGLLEGVTTNPLIIRRGIKEMRYRGKFLVLAKKILELAGDRPVFFQAIGHNTQELEEQAERAYYILRGYGNPYIKVPFNPSLSLEEKDNMYAGIEAIRRLRRKRIPILATAVVTPVQAFLAARAGANYSVLMLRPYDNIVAENIGVELAEDSFLDNEKVAKECVKRNKTLPDSFFTSGIDTLRRTRRIFKEHNLETRLLIAGIRNIIQLSTALEEGVDAVTLPYKVFCSIFPHEGTRRFVKDTYDGCPEIYRRFLRE